MSSLVADLIANTRKMLYPNSAAAINNDQVVAAASALFRRRGYSATTEDESCDATGVSPPVLKEKFGARHGLLIRTLQVYAAGQLAALESGLAASESPWKWVTSAVVFDDGRLPLDISGCYLAATTSSLSEWDFEVRELSRTSYAKIAEVFARALLEARDRDELRADVDIEDAALVLLTAMQGIEFLRRASLDRVHTHATASIITALTIAYAKQDSDTITQTL